MCYCKTPNYVALASRPKKPRIDHFPRYANSAIPSATITFRYRRGVEFSWQRRRQQQRSLLRRKSRRVMRRRRPRRLLTFPLLRCPSASRRISQAADQLGSPFEDPPTTSIDLEGPRLGIENLAGQRQDWFYSRRNGSGFVV